MRFERISSIVTSTPPRGKLHKIAVLGNSPPRQCGIATFTCDLAQTLVEVDPSLFVETVAMSDRHDYEYPANVGLQIFDKDPAAYASASDHLNRKGHDVLSIQHEYGIFGGEAGSYLMNLVREAKMPIVTTLHTVLRDPSPAQKAVMDELLERSDRIVVMSKKAVEFLSEVHGTCPGKVDLIPHGIPAIDDAVGQEFRRTLEIQGPMILTFGLLSPDKGVQYVIEAMPEILKEVPGATYMVVGATHPHIRGSGSGEEYRQSLVKLAQDLGVEQNVRFIDRFVSLDELRQYLAAMDIYVTPYLNPKQITSGTLAYAVGAGKAVVSTPYWYAEELLEDGRGMLVPFRDAGAISAAVLEISGSTEVREAMGKKAAEFGRQMRWPEVGRSYLDSFARAKAASSERLRALVEKPVLVSSIVDVPDQNFEHLFELSDDTGILQHATFTTPARSEGYCVDDNARALLLTVMLEEEGQLSPKMHLLQGRYLSFIQHAMNPDLGRFRNFMSYGREWLESVGSEDSHGRTLWALGTLVNRSRDRNRRDLARNVFGQGVPATLETTSLRTWAYALLGADEYLQAHPRDTAVLTMRQTLIARLWEQFQANEQTGWPWFEPQLTYANARLAQALIVTGKSVECHEVFRAGLRSLSWLMRVQLGPEMEFAPIGSDGFYYRHNERQFFDQQPIEAWASVSACLSAFSATGDPTWMRQANHAFRWFLGKNMLGVPVYDQETGGCSDGLHADRLNRNQGAESTLAYHCAAAELRSSSFEPVSMVIERGQHGLK